MANAGVATGTGIARQPKASIKATAGVATGTGAAYGALAGKAVYPQVARGVGTAYNPSQYQPRLVTTPTGNPLYPFNLFRGQMIRSDVERIGELLKVTLTISDYNRLWPLLKLGAPFPFGTGYIQPDGTTIYTDPNALNYGNGPGDGGVFRYHVENYWPVIPYSTFPGLVTHVYQTDPDYSAIPVIDWGTALSDLGSFLNEIASRASGSTRYWIDADMEGHWTTVGPTPYEADFRVPAPFEIDMDGPIQSGNVIQAMSLTASADHSQLRRRVYVRGGTPASSVWVDHENAPLTSGEDYVDAPGAVTREDGIRIANWWLKWNFRTFITGSAHISANDPTNENWEGHDGWRVGQSIVLSDATLSRLNGLALDQHEAIITSVTGRLISPGTGLFIEIDENILDVDYNVRVTKWQSLTFTERGFGEPGTATLTIEILDPLEEFNLRPQADVRIFTDGTAALEYDLEWGDIAAGALSEQIAKIKQEEQKVIPPAYKIIWDGDKLLIPVGGSTPIIGQLSDASDKAVKLPGVFVAYELLQWTDLTETIVGTGFTLASSGTDISSAETNTEGQIYDTLQRAEGTATVVYPEGHALPIE